MSRSCRRCGVGNPKENPMSDRPVDVPGEPLTSQDGPNTYRMPAPRDVTLWATVKTIREAPNAAGTAMEQRTEWWLIPSHVVTSILASTTPSAEAVPAECRHDARWIEEFTSWVIRAHEQRRSEAVPAEGDDSEPEVHGEASMLRHEAWRRRQEQREDRAVPAEDGLRELLDRAYTDPNGHEWVSADGEPDVDHPRQEPCSSCGGSGVVTLPEAPAGSGLDVNVLAQAYTNIEGSGVWSEGRRVPSVWVARRAADIAAEYDRLALAAATERAARSSGDLDALLPTFEVGQVVGELQPGRRRHDWCSIHGAIGPGESIDAHARSAHGSGAEAIRKARRVLGRALAARLREPRQTEGGPE